MNYDQNGDSNIRVEVREQLYEGNTRVNNNNIIKNQTKSQGSYNIELFSHAAEYYLTITASKQANITLILGKLSFTHLIAGRSLMLTYPTVFEIFSPGDSIMI